MDNNQATIFIVFLKRRFLLARFVILRNADPVLYSFDHNYQLSYNCRYKPRNNYGNPAFFFEHLLT